VNGLNEICAETLTPEKTASLSSLHSSTSIQIINVIFPFYRQRRLQTNDEWTREKQFKISTRVPIWRTNLNHQSRSVRVRPAKKLGYKRKLGVFRQGFILAFQKEIRFICMKSDEIINFYHRGGTKWLNSLNRVLNVNLTS
jgi:hypothetical protein